MASTSHNWVSDINGPILNQPLAHDPGQQLQYGLGFTCQVSPTQAVMLVNIRMTGCSVVDFENGFDAVVFDDVSRITPEGATPVARNRPGVHPRSGAPLTLVNTPATGGFVPLGAKLPDGRPHPHAGTGFALTIVRGYPADNSVHNAHVAADLHSFLMLYQFRFDGSRFEVVSSEEISKDQLLPGWRILAGGLSPAMPDGCDMLFGMVGGCDDEVTRDHHARLQAAGRKPNGSDPVLGECYGCGVSRWRYGSQGWRPIDFMPVPRRQPDMATEPSLVRDWDGALLCCVRGARSSAQPGEMDHGLENTYHHLRVYRSADNGATWNSVVHRANTRAATPVSLHRTAGGELFIAANPLQEGLIDSHGAAVPTWAQRDLLSFWPLSEDRNEVLPTAVSWRAEELVGPLRPYPDDTHDNRWYLDHCISAVVRLADEKWHTLLTFRAIDSAINHGGAGPESRCGPWLVRFDDPDQPTIQPWQF